MRRSREAKEGITGEGGKEVENERREKEWREREGKEGVTGEGEGEEEEKEKREKEKGCSL